MSADDEVLGRPCAAKNGCGTEEGGTDEELRGNLAGREEKLRGGSARDGYSGEIERRKRNG
jgi:hypothetical protein